MKEIILSSILYILKFGINVIYTVLKLFPTKNNKITFLSRQSDNINIDFKLLIEEIKRKDKNINIQVLCKKIPQGLLKRICYCIYMIKCMYHIATSKVCVTDGYSIPISSLKHKKELIIIQIWHAMGAIKKFGKQVLDKKEGNSSITANIMQMHKNYSYIICTSSKTREFYADAFQTDKEKILTLGMPRIDYLLGKDNIINEKVEKILENHPNLKSKKIILYVPTFRKGKKIPVKELIENVDNNKYNLIIKLHPLDKTQIDPKYTVDSNISTMELLKIADYVITDYSAIAFEAAVLSKPIFFYLYDINEYMENRGLNINIKKEMKNSTSTDIKTILNIIENNSYNHEELNKFKEKYIETLDTNNTERIARHILKNINE